MKPILLLILASLFLVAAGEPCPGVRSLPVVAACQEACGTKLMYDMCMDTLREFDKGMGLGPDPPAPHSVEVTAYALLAAQRARESFAATVRAAEELLSGSLDRDDREAYDACAVDYGYADSSLRRVATDMLPGCSFGGLADEYMNAVVHVESCRTRLIRLTASPLYAMNLIDRNKDLLAYSLGQLLAMTTKDLSSINPADAKTAGENFIGLYYKALTCAPADVHRLYHEGKSTLSRPGHDGHVTSLNTLNAIKEYYLYSELKDCSVQLENIDTQPSLVGSIFVVATGYFSFKNAVKYKFAQSFLLAPQAQGYFVVNDCLRYFREVPCAETKKDLVDRNNNSATTSVKDKVIDSTGVSKIPDVASAPAYPVFQSYASIVKPVEKASPVSANTTHVAETVPLSDKKVCDGQSFSVYVRNLPFGATKRMIEAELGKFGIIKSSGTRIVERDTVCYGFIEYESQEAMDAAIKAGQVSFGSHRSSVEKQKSQTRVNSGVAGVTRVNNNFNARGSSRSRSLNQYSGRGGGPSR